MGSKLSKKNNFNVLSVGLDESGKTEAIYYLKYLQTIKTIPTIGVNIETIDYKGYTFSIWDNGGQDKIRVLWKHYVNKVDGIMFFIDSSNRDRIEDAAEELKKLLAEDQYKECCILVLANKQDLKGALPPEDITRLFEMEKLKGITWLVQGTSTKTGQGIKEGFNWLANCIIKANKNKK